MDNISIENASKQKLLGIYIDENLNWSAHIDYLCSNVSSKISLLRQLSQYVHQHVQKLFFQSYILPLIVYGSVIWGSTSSSNLERLLKLQKRAARIIFKADFRTPSVQRPRLAVYRKQAYCNCCQHLYTNTTITSFVNGRTFSVINNSDLD